MAVGKRQKYRNATMRRSLFGPATRNLRPHATPLVPTLSAHSGSTLPLTFPVAISYSGILPAYTAGSTHVTGVTVTSPTTVTLTFSGTPTTPLVVPFEDPAFRGADAGFVQPGSYTIT
jgi:hypothetical protein